VAVVLVPSGVTVFVAWARTQPDLAALHGGRVSSVLASTLPAMRVSLLDGNPEVTGENNAAHPVISVECWDSTPEGADTLMRTLIAALPQLAAAAVTLPRGGTAYVSSVGIDLGPLVSDDPDTGDNRQLVDLVLGVHNP
jgi:hypothetical protein